MSWALCTKCNGFGTVHDYAREWPAQRPCPTCHGDGKVWVRPVARQTDPDDVGYTTTMDGDW